MIRIAVQVIYVLASLPLTAIVGYGLVPFLISMEPYQLVLGRSFAVKLVASILYSITGICEIGISSFVLITCVNVVIAAIAETQRVCATLQAPENPSRRRFQTSYRLLQSTRVLISLEGLGRFLGALIFLGILYGSGFGYCVVKLFGVIPLIFYVVIAFNCPIIIVAAIMGPYVGGFQVRNVPKFRELANKEHLSRENRMCLKAIPDVGFFLGPYGLCSAQVGLTIFDDIMNNTATIILLNPM